MVQAMLPSIERLDAQSKMQKKSLHSDDEAREGVFNRDSPVKLVSIDILN